MRRFFILMSTALTLLCACGQKVGPEGPEEPEKDPARDRPLSLEITETGFYSISVKASSDADVYVYAAAEPEEYVASFKNDSLLLAGILNKFRKGDGRKWEDLGYDSWQEMFLAERCRKGTADMKLEADRRVDNAVLAFGLDSRLRYLTEVKRDAVAPIRDLSVSVSNVGITTAKVKVSADDMPYYMSYCEVGDPEASMPERNLVEYNLKAFSDRYGSTYSIYGYASLKDMYIDTMCHKGDFETTLTDLTCSTRHILYVYYLDEDMELYGSALRMVFTTKDL